MNLACSYLANLNFKEKNMDNAITAALSKQTGLIRQLDVTSNNVANSSTKGFKAQKVLFQDYVVNEGSNHKLALTSDIGSFDDPTQGSITVTNRELDIAIQGAGYLIVKTPFGDRYTRGGNFITNAEGILSDANLNPILTVDHQPVVIPAGAKTIVFTADGAITVDGQETQKLGIVNFEAGNFLEHIGQGLYKASTGDVPATSYKIVQGGLEESNVSSVNELKDLVNTQRAGDLVANLINSISELERNAVSKLTNAVK
jgi:flagellar basal-body rod protein FlgF